MPQNAGVKRVVKAGMLLYIVMLLGLLYVVRFSIFALFVNPSSIVSFLVGIGLIAYLVGAIPVGMAYVSKPSGGKLAYIVLAALLVVGGLASLALG